MMTNNTESLPAWLVSKLMDAGLSKQQAMSKTAAVVAETLNTEDGKELVRYTNDKCQRLITKTMAELEEMRKTHIRLSEEVKGISDDILAIKESTEEWGELSDQKAKDAISLYSALLAVSKKYGNADIEGAGYMVYAYLGGQAARNIFTGNPQKSDAKSATRLSGGIEGLPGTIAI